MLIERYDNPEHDLAARLWCHLNKQAWRRNPGARNDTILGRTNRTSVGYFGFRRHMDCYYVTDAERFADTINLLLGRVM